MKAKCSKLLFHVVSCQLVLTLMVIVIIRWTTKNPGFTINEDHVQQFSDRTETDFQHRRERYLDACSAETSGQVRQVLVDPVSGLAVCHTPKVGCTFWKRIMTFLQSKDKRLKTPFEINRYVVHHAPPVKITYNFESTFVQERVSNLTRIVFGRDPYSRLWSSYVDKIILPEGFGLGIYKYRSIGHVKCPLHVSFEDFLRHALYKFVDIHWAPLHTICNPCRFYPRYIGKMDTFTRDVAYILNSSGQGNLLRTLKLQSHAEDEMSMLIQYNFKSYGLRNISPVCLTTTGLAGRLWRAFQLNGYISLTERFPEIKLNKSLHGLGWLAAGDIVQEMFVDHYKRNPKSKSEIHLQKQSVISDAYRDIPLLLREEISRMYARDFTLFGYQRRPRNIFPEDELTHI